MITLKIKYQTENTRRILEYIKNYNSVYNSIFNYLKKQNRKLSTKESFNFINSLNHIFVDTYFKNGALRDAQQSLVLNKDKKVIFGGRKLFFDRIKNLVSKEEFQIKKLRSLQIVGRAYNKGNCKFQILNENEVLFKPCKKEHFNLNFKNIGKNYQKKLKSLILAQEKCLIPITYKLDTEFIYISYENEKLEKVQTKNKLKDRIFAIDLNPNYIGWTIVDWKSEKGYKLIKSGMISIKKLNNKENLLNVPPDSPEKKYITNKRKYETIQIGYNLIKLANYYRCQIFGIEDLNIKSSDKSKGRNFNRLCNNQWNRNLLTNLLNKLCNLYGIHFQKVMANYSSFLGNLVYRKEKLPDPCLASIEIGRRGYEFYHQYILKDKEKEKNIIFDKLEDVKDRVAKSLEELNCSCSFENLSDLYYKLKKARCNYRFSLEKALKEHQKSFSSLKHSKSYTILYSF